MQLATADGNHIRGYVARPKAAGRFPAVIVVNEVFGLHAYILDICRRLAKLGYVAIAPGFFVRAGDPAPLPISQCDRSEDRRHGQRPAGDGRRRRDAEVPGGAALRRARASIAITGFCWGGKVVWHACETFPRLKAGVAWYGQMAPGGTAPADPAHPRLWPVEHAADLHVPVLGLYGGKDPLSQAVPGDARRR